ncbi:TPA: hypothetical protein SAN82_004177 [Pseudomonas putida]|nr:hypothetical protein [Pseudomonas putida]
MSPKHPIRPKVPGPSIEGPTGIRDTTPDTLPRRPVNTPSLSPDQTQRNRFPDASALPDPQFPQIEITDLPAETHISRVITDLPISNYYLPQKLVERLPAPDPETGIRSIFFGRQYVDLVDGGTVPLGSDTQGHFRAKQMSELVPSGPILERIEGTLTWRRHIPPIMNSGDSTLIVSRYPLATEAQTVPSKRPRQMDEEPSLEAIPTDADERPITHFPRLPASESSSTPWKNWGVSPQHALSDHVTIDGVHYKTLPRRGEPEHPIAYIKHPEHPNYDFDSIQRLLTKDIQQQPRGAIQVPPGNHWQIDPNLPFSSSLTDYVATYFPELTARSVQDVARHQFLQANGSDLATGAGLTTLRQIFNDWKTRNITPRPDLADPLLMLPIVPMTPGKGSARVLELPLLADQSPLQRLTFDPGKFHQEWDYYAISTQSAMDNKQFISNLLTRNGYTVFELTDARSYPALVFQRAGHDFVFYMTLHRIKGKKIHIPAARDQGFSSTRQPELIGLPAMRAVQRAQAANKLIWLKGGGQISADRPDSVVIVRSDDPGI